MNRPSDPMNAEERDLARRLARLGGPREPAPALDAKILAMAREAAAGSPEAAPPEDAQPSGTAPDPKIVPLRRRTPMQRWPLGMGLAASLVLAAGLGWKLHLAGGQSAELPAASPAAAADSSDDSFEVGPPLPRDAADAAAAPAAPDSAAADATSQMAKSAAPAEKLERAPVTTADAVEPARSESAPAPAVAEVVAADAPAAAEPEAFPPASPPPAPAAPPAPAVVVTDNTGGKLEIDPARTPRSDAGNGRNVGAAEYTRTPLDQRRQQISASRSAEKAASSAPPPPSGLSASERARQNTGTLRSGATEHDKDSETGSYDERPPVSADSQEFRQAWLQRIRALIAKGDTPTAIDSLKEFHRRYPDVDLPDDLRKLLPAQPQTP